MRFTFLHPDCFLIMLRGTVLLFSLIALVWSGVLNAKDLETLSRSPIWQVRYCIPKEFDSPSPIARTVLERLSRDEVSQVARQAFAVYSGHFVELERELVRRSFARGDFDLIGVKVSDRNVFETPAFWRGALERASDDSIRARAIRSIGLCGDQSDFAKLSDFLQSRNPSLLTELALAFHRLGDTKSYLGALEAVLDLPISESLHYQIHAVDSFIQTHPERASEAWRKLQKQIEGTQNLQLGWIYRHTLQEERLP